MRCRRIFLTLGIGNTLLVLSLLGWGLTASAETVEVVTGEWSPYSGETLPRGGFTSEIVRNAFATRGHTVVIDFRPWKRGYKETLDHRYLETFPYSRNEEREALFLLSEPVYASQVLWFAREDLDIEYTKDEDLQGLRVCHPLGYSTKSIQPFIDKKLIGLITPEGDKECFKLLKNGRAHLYAVSELAGWQTIEELYGAREGFRTLRKPLRENTYHLMVARDYPDAARWLEEFDQGLETLRQQGVFQDILARHLDQ